MAEQSTDLTGDPFGVRLTAHGQGMDELERLAVARRRVVSTRELHAIGLTDSGVRRLARTGELVHLVRGAYAVPPLDESMERAVARAVTRQHPRGAISCEYALALHGADIPFPGQLHLVRPDASHSVDSHDIRLHRTNAPVEVVGVDGIATVHPAIALMGAWADLSDLDDRRAVVCAALVSGVTNAAAVAGRRPGLRRVAGAGHLLRTCELVELGCESPPEIDFYLHVEVAHRLPPPPARQRWIVLPNDRRRRVDVLYEGARLIIEIDGSQHWLDEATLAEDRHNDLALRAVGYRILRFTWRDIRERPGWVAARVRRALAGAA